MSDSVDGDDHGSEDAVLLRRAGIRPTRQRLAVLRTIRTGGRRHLTPESFHQELADAGLRLSLATVYNTLNHFAGHGLLRRVGFCDRTYFCTHAAPHHHFYDEATGRLEDIDGPQPGVTLVPAPPEGMEVVGVEIIVRLRRTDPSGAE